MDRRHITGLATIAMLTSPSTAMADGATPDPLTLSAGALTLVAAVALMALSLMLARVSRGSIVAENITFVVAASLCLAASVLASWVGLFQTDGLAASQARVGADFLTGVGLVLLCAYFWRVRSALARFTRGVAAVTAGLPDPAAEGPDADA